MPRFGIPPALQRAWQAYRALVVAELRGPITTKASGLELITPWPSTGGWLHEAFAGAWQRGVKVPLEDAISHPSVWSCVTLIAGDLAKLEVDLVTEDETAGISVDAASPAFSPVLAKPNHYQTRIQFWESYFLAKLCRGNAYILKERDNRGIVVALYPLDPTRVRPMISPSGDVYYACGQDVLNGITEQSTVVPAREIIHDRWNCIYHPLVGLSPIFACGHMAVQSQQIVHNATRLSRQGFQVGGILTAPGHISEDTAKRLERYWEEHYGGDQNAGKIAALGDGMKFERPELMSFVDAQVIDQLKWDDEKVCSVFHVPAYMVGVGPPPNYNNIAALNQQYYSQCLQILIESAELCLEEGLGLVNAGYEAEFDLDGLLRMDASAQMDAATKGVKGGIYTPNEARAQFDLLPLTGGDTVYLQEQDHSLEWLAKRDAQGPPPVTPPAMPPARETPALPPAKASEDVDVAALLTFITRAYEEPA